MVDRPRRPQPGEFALGYVRVSTDEQGDNYSLGEQEREIRAFAEREGVVLDAVLSDENTGSVGVRPGIVRLFERVRQARGRHRWIIVWKGDRWNERIEDKYDRALFDRRVTEAGLQVYDLSRGDRGQTAHDELLDDVLSAFGRHERKMIRLRTTMGREARAREDGLFWGGRRPFGFQFGPGVRRGKPIGRGRLVPDPDEAAVVRLIYEQFTAGATISSIARYLDEHVPHITPTGSASRKSGAWTTHAVRFVLSNPAYTGKLFVNRTTYVEPTFTLAAVRGRPKTRCVPRPRDEWIEVKAGVDPIVSQATYDAAQARLADTRRAMSRGHQPYMLRGLLFHSCGRAGTGESRKGGRPDGMRAWAPLLHHMPYAGYPDDMPWGWYDPNRYYACQDCRRLALAWTLENTTWFWLGEQMWDDAFLDRLAAKAAIARRRS